MQPGDTIPALAVQGTSGLQTTLEAMRGHWLVLYFYPKDATPGCTREGQDFRDNMAAFEALNARIFGISRDSLKSHEKFRTCEQFPFELLSDPDEALCKAFDVIRDKSMYGKMVRGIERSTFLVDPHGVVRQVWRKVRVEGHVEAVLDTLRAVNA